MKFSYNWLQSYFNQKLPKPDKLAEILTLHFAEVEDVKKEGNDFVINIDVRPNRAGDCFSHNGIAMEIAAILSCKLRVVSYQLKEDKRLKTSDFVSVQLQGRGPLSRYTARVVTGVKVGPSPKWMQERLIACGLRPVNNVVDATNYVMLETGQPLHAFDAEKISGRKIIVRFAKAGEKINTLDGENYNLDDDIFVISDSKKPMAIAGIKGGKSAEIDSKTKTIAIEAANFNSQVIRRASRKIGLRTDASLRFEHGLDPNLTIPAADRAAALIQKIAGGKIAKGVDDIYPKKVLPKLISLNPDYVKSLLGIKISETEIRRILKSLGFEVDKNLRVKVPTSRMDVCVQEDLIEEIGRIYGYEKIPVVLPKTILAVPAVNPDVLWEKMIKNALKESDFHEFYNYSFISARDAHIFGFKTNDLVEIANPLSTDFLYLTPNLLPNLLKNIEKNQKNFPHMKIFELGKVFSIGVEQKTVTGLLSGDAFYEAKGVIDLFLNRLGISDIWYDSYRTPEQESKIMWWHPKKCAEIKIGNDRIGFVGEISHKILAEYRINLKIIYFDILFDKLATLASQEHEYRPISKFPAAVRDIAVLVPNFVKVEEVLNKIETAGGNLVRDIDLFDIYEGDELPDQKKNLAFHIIYQAQDKTLSASEIDEMQNKIINAIERMPDWQVRK